MGVISPSFCAFFVWGLGMSLTAFFFLAQESLRPTIF